MGNVILKSKKTVGYEKADISGSAVWSPVDECKARPAGCFSKPIAFITHSAT